MEKLGVFVENMFLSLPDTPETREARAHILEGMTDRYEALLAQGKNENEAFGIVAGEFGSMEELRQELGLSDWEGEPRHSTPAVPFPQEEYDAFRRRLPIAITCGVVLCILAIAAGFVFDQLSWTREAGLDRIAFFVIIAAAVGLFVYFGIQEEQYQKLLQLSRGKAKREKDSPCRKAIMLAATGVYLILGFCRGLWHPGWVVFLLGAALAHLADFFIDTMNPPYEREQK